MSTLYLDLDGTLIDIRLRHYRAYSEAVSSLGGTPLPRRAYWARRRRGSSSPALLGEVEDTYRERFLAQWLVRIESPPYLRLDTLIPGTRRALAALAESYDLTVVTLRRDWGCLIEQLSRLGLMDFVSTVYGRGSSDQANSKANLIRLAGSRADARSIVVGDSEEDIRCARELGLASVCVTSGVRNHRYLASLRPNHIIPSMARLPQLLQSLGDTQVAVPDGPGRSAPWLKGQPEITQPTNV